MSVSQFVNLGAPSFFAIFFFFLSVFIRPRDSTSRRKILWGKWSRLLTYARFAKNAARPFTSHFESWRPLRLTPGRKRGRKSANLLALLYGQKSGKVPTCWLCCTVRNQDGQKKTKNKKYKKQMWKKRVSAVLCLFGKQETIRGLPGEREI